MLDELEKRRIALDESLETLQGKLEPILKDSPPGQVPSDDCEPQPQSVVCRRIEQHSDLLVQTRETVESIINRLDIPS